MWRAGRFFTIECFPAVSTGAPLYGVCVSHELDGALRVIELRSFDVDGNITFSNFSRRARCTTRTRTGNVLRAKYNTRHIIIIVIVYVQQPERRK